MRLPRLWIALIVVMLAILGRVMTLSDRGYPADAAIASQGKPIDRAAQFETEILVFERKLVKAAPFSATLVMELTREGGETLATTSKIYRDAEGRTRRDQMRANDGDDPDVTSINDPVAGFTCVLHHSDKTARRTKLTPHADEKSDDALEVMRNAVAVGERAGSYQMRPVPLSSGTARDLKPKALSVVSGGPTSESLGEKEIEGGTAQGTRTIVTIPVGAIGNERVLEIVTERWYSQRLKTLVLMERFDPRFGRSTLRLTGIKNLDPAANLFIVPSNYKIIIE